jgi:hypothetical protein
MDAHATRETRFAALHREMATLHFENKGYWDQGLEHTDEVMGAYGRRQTRLGELRTELEKMRASDAR